MPSSPSPTKQLTDFLESWDFGEEAAGDSIRDWPIKQLDTFLEQAQDVLSECTTGTAALVNSTKDKIVLFPELRAQLSTSLFRRCLLYADSVVVPIVLPFPGAFTEAGRREQTLLHLADIWRVLPFLRTGIFLPVQQTFGGFNEDAYEPLVNKLLSNPEIKATVEKHIKVGKKSDVLSTTGPTGDSGKARVEYKIAGFDGNFAMGAACSNIPPLHTVSIPLVHIDGPLQVPDQSEVQPGTELYKLVLSTISSRLSSIIADWQLATSVFRANLVTKSDVCWDILQGIEGEFRGRQQEKIERVVTTLDLPFLDKLDPHAILEERERSRDSLDAFRVSLAKFSVAGQKAVESGASEPEIALLRDQYLAEPVREINGKLDEVRAQSRVLAIGGAVAIAVASFAIYSGQSPMAIISGLGALGACKPLVELAKENAAVERSPMHFLWRVKTRAES
jgi:hypothetical protein